jgi:hypothetical protein
VQDLKLGSSENEARRGTNAPVNSVHHFGKILKAKVYSITGLEGPEYRYSSTLSLTSALDGGGGVGDQRHAPTALPPRNGPVPIVQQAGLAPGLVWTGAKNLAPSPPPGFDSRTV